MKASFQIAECSLYSAKVRVFYQITKVLRRFLLPLNLSCKITIGKPRIAIDKLEKEWKQYPVFPIDFIGINFTDAGMLDGR